MRKIISKKSCPTQEQIAKQRAERKQLYREYLDSQVWFEKRAIALTRDGHRCRLCYSKRNVNVHHRRYPKVLGEEPLNDLITLCAKCHEKFHDIQNTKPTLKKKKAKKQISELAMLIAKQKADATLNVLRGHGI